MANERLLIPQYADYFHALCLAAVAFARLEWDAVRCCESLQKDYISTIESKKKTSVFIARDLEALFGRISHQAFRLKVVPFAQAFLLWLRIVTHFSMANRERQKNLNRSFSAQAHLCLLRMLMTLLTGARGPAHPLMRCFTLN